MSRAARTGDRRLTCADCGEGYVWSASEQEFYKAKGYEPPKRCKPCREAKKARRGNYSTGRGGKQ